MTEEKSQLEKCLEEERKQKDLKIKHVLKQQQIYLDEKESKLKIFILNFHKNDLKFLYSKELLSKYAKTQEKLEQLKRHQRLMKLESISFSTAKNRDKTPPQKQQQHETNSFSPDKVKILMLKFKILKL